MRRGASRRTSPSRRSYCRRREIKGPDELKKQSRTGGHHPAALPSSPYVPLTWPRWAVGPIMPERSSVGRLEKH
jgi:hypothetical protein